MSFFFKSDDAHTSEVGDTLQYFNAAHGRLADDNDVPRSGVRPKGPRIGGRKKKNKKTNRLKTKQKFGLFRFFMM